MSSVVCTLFEGHYHYGLAALVNSLCRSSFSGTIFAGFRGTPPAWAKREQPGFLGPYETFRLKVGSTADIIFVRLTTDAHLTNFKPDFMLEVLDNLPKQPREIFYLDPDICVAEDWTFFRDWADCGVALCEDINSPLAKNHPRRIGWRKSFPEANLGFQGAEYVNGGCVGLQPQYREFLAIWKKLSETMGQILGGRDVAKVEGGSAMASKGFANCFDCTDQDALNAAREAFAGPTSILGQEAMGFKSGKAILPHALGAPKPWRRFYLRDALAGRPPRLVDKLYLAASQPIAVRSPLHTLIRQADCGAATLLGRFIRRA